MTGISFDVHPGSILAWLCSWITLVILSRWAQFRWAQSFQNNFSIHSSALCITLTTDRSPSFGFLRRRRRLRQFYSLGASAACIGMFIATAVVGVNLISNVAPASMLAVTSLRLGRTDIAAHRISEQLPPPQPQLASSRKRGMVVQPLIPGYSIPLGDGALLFAAALTSLIVHEAGHAAAAVGEGVRYDPEFKRSFSVPRRDEKEGRKEGERR